MANTSPMYFEQPIVIFDTTEALNLTTGSFVLYGGVSVNSTYNSNSISTGAFVVAGGAAIQKDLNVGGITNIRSTADSSGTNSGALVVAGGVGIAKDLHVGGDTTILGNLYVNGSQTIVNTTTIDVGDNTILLNAGPAGSGDGGTLIARFGTDVTDFNEPVVTTGNLVSVAQTSIQLPAAMAQSDNYYRGWWIKTPDGVAQITSYTSSNQLAALSTSGNTLPVTPTTASFSLYNRSYVASYYSENSDEYRLAYIADATDPNYTLQNFQNYINFRCNDLYANNMVSTSNLVVTGGATIANLAISNSYLSAATIGTLAIIGSTVLNGPVTVGSINVTGASNLQGGLTTGSLYVTGGTNLNGVTAGSIDTTYLNVTGGATIANLAISSSFLSAATIGNLSVNENTILNGAVTAGSLDVTGASTFQLGLTAGSIFVTGNSVLNGPVTAGSLTVTGGLTTGSLNVTGGSILQLGLTAGSLNVTGSSNLSGGLTTGSLNVTGASLLQEGLTAGSLFVTGSSILNGTITAGGLAVTGASYFNSNMTISSGSLTVTGGSIVFNTVDVSPSMGDIIKERSATVGNAIVSPTNVQGFAFDSAVARAFDAVVSVSIDAASNQYAYYNLKGIQKDTTWVINSSFVGDVIPIVFSINSSGQILYTTQNIGGFVSGTVKFRALTTSV